MWHEDDQGNGAYNRAQLRAIDQQGIRESEPKPRGSAEWYAWAELHPQCCNCSNLAVEHVELNGSSGWFCDDCRWDAGEIMSAIVE